MNIFFERPTSHLVAGNAAGFSNGSNGEADLRILPPTTVFFGTRLQNEGFMGVFD